MGIIDNLGQLVNIILGVPLVEEDPKTPEEIKMEIYSYFHDTYSNIKLELDDHLTQYQSHQRRHGHATIVETIEMTCMLDNKTKEHFRQEKDTCERIAKTFPNTDMNIISSYLQQMGNHPPVDQNAVEYFEKITAENRPNFYNVRQRTIKIVKEIKEHEMLKALAQKNYSI